MTKAATGKYKVIVKGLTLPFFPLFISNYHQVEILKYYDTALSIDKKKISKQNERVVLMTNIEC